MTRKAEKIAYIWLLSDFYNLFILLHTINGNIELLNKVEFLSLKPIKIA